MAEQEAVTVFKEYLRIRTDHPSPDYDSAVTFLTKQAGRLKLPVEVYGTKTKPIVVISWKGQNPDLQSIMLNSHMDVVPVYPEKWTHDPFSATQTDDGKIYGRGTQDMKSQGIQYIEAILKLQKEGFKPLRTIHLVYVPDEEIGGEEGMFAFVKAPAFKSLNVGFAIDESCACPLDFVIAFFDERCNWTLDITCYGTTGHACLLMPNTAADKARIIVDEFLDKRASEVKKLEGKPFRELELANVTTINLTMFNGGVQKNVVPDHFKLSFDIRVSVNENHDEFLEWIQGVIKKAGDGVELKFFRREEKGTPTKTDDSNPYWVALKSAVDGIGLKVMPVACPGNTDARMLRKEGIPSIGFSPMTHTPLLLHGHDEYIEESVFLKGIDVFTEVIRKISSTP